MASKIGLGIDFGGTKLLGAIVDLETGKVLATSKKKSSAADSAKEVMERMYDLADATLKEGKLKASEIAGIGVGIAGQVDAAKGILLGTPNLSQAVVELPIVELLKKRYKVPAALRNDVQIAAVGEMAHGAGRGARSFLCCFVGTGVGGAIVEDGKLVSGASGSAGEIGHLVIDAGGRLCGCGGSGHLEAYASRTAITDTLLGHIKRGRPTILRDLMPEIGEGEGGAAIRSGVLAKAVEARDPLVTETIHDAGRYLGLGLASVINLLNPGRIVLGGGVIEAVDLLFDIAVEHAMREALPTPARFTEIVRAGLGDYSGVVGAALLGAGARKK
ncbi:MAG: ROK family protein [Thermomicrobiales bacterium]